MTDQALAALVLKMHQEAAIQSSLSRRVGYEHLYFREHYNRGIRLRGKYRPR